MLPVVRIEAEKRYVNFAQAILVKELASSRFCYAAAKKGLDGPRQMGVPVIPLDNNLVILRPPPTCLHCRLPAIRSLQVDAKVVGLPATTVAAVPLRVVVRWIATIGSNGGAALLARPTA